MPQTWSQFDEEVHTVLDMKLALGFRGDDDDLQRRERTELLRYINLKLAANGLPIVPAAGGGELVALASGLLTNFREKTRLLDNHRCPVDQRIETYLNEHFADLKLDEPLRVPGRAMELDRHGLARELSLPVRAPYASGLVSLPVQISTIRNGITRLYSSTALEFTVAASDTLGTNLASAIRALAPTSQPQRNARDRAATDAQNGLTLMAQGSYANAVLKFLSAADELASITTTSVALARGQLASLIAEAEARQCVNP